MRGYGRNNITDVELREIVKKITQKVFKLIGSNPVRITNHSTVGTNVIEFDITTNKRDRMDVVQESTTAIYNGLIMSGVLRNNNKLRYLVEIEEQEKGMWSHYFTLRAIFYFAEDFERAFDEDDGEVKEV